MAHNWGVTGTAVCQVISLIYGDVKGALEGNVVPLFRHPGDIRSADSTSIPRGGLTAWALFVAPRSATVPVKVIYQRLITSKLMIKLVPLNPFPGFAMRRFMIMIMKFLAESKLLFPIV
jgi:hypothetical protein